MFCLGRKVRECLRQSLGGPPLIAQQAGHCGPAERIFAATEELAAGFEQLVFLQGVHE